MKRSDVQVENRKDQENKKTGKLPLAVILAVLLVVTLSLMLAIMLLFGPSVIRKSDSTPDFGNTREEAHTSGTTEEQEETTADEDKDLIQIDDSGIEGNLFINISEGGMMRIIDDRVLYTNPADEYKIYSMNLRFEDNRLECDIPSFYLNDVGRTLIFAGADGGSKQLYSMDLDSGSVHTLSEQVTYEPKIKDGFIYYDDVDEKYSLYRCRLDGSDRVCLSPGAVFYSCITEDAVYYLDTQDDYHLYSMDLNGGSKRVIYDQSSRELCLMGDCLYLSSREGGIQKYDLKSEQRLWISDVNAASLVVASDGWMYFANRDNEDKLYKMRQDGSDLTKLSNDPVAFINVVSNLISYQNKETGDFYWILTDGSCCRKVQ